MAITDTEMQEEVQRIMGDTGMTSVWTGLTEGHDKLWRWSEGELEEGRSEWVGEWEVGDTGVTSVWTWLNE